MAIPDAGPADQDAPVIPAIPDAGRRRLGDVRVIDAERRRVRRVDADVVVRDAEVVEIALDDALEPQARIVGADDDRLVVSHARVLPRCRCWRCG
jgi:hypothetical protein